MSGDNDLIVPSGIPQFTGHLDQLDSDALALSAEAVLFRTSGASVHSTFQGLSAFYKAPEAEQLFATTGPVATKSDSIADDLEKAASALSAYSAEVRPVVARLKSLKADAIAFVDSVQGDEHWRRDQDKVDHNNDLWHDVNAAEDAFTSAERACYSKITALVGGAPLIADDGSHKPNMYGYKADVLDHAEQTPWGAPAEREYTGLAWLGHQAKSYVWDGFVVDGVWGTVKGLGTLVGTDGWDKAGQAWEGLAKLATGLALSSPGIAPFYWSTPDKKLPSWLRDSRKAVKDTGKALVAWDEWGKNPARAAGAVTFNIVTTVFTEGAGTAAKTGALAKTVSVVGKAGRLVDPMTYVGKAGKFATIKVGDLFAGLRNVHSGAYNGILSGTGHLQPDGTVLKTGADTPVVTGTHIEWPDGTRLDLDDGTVVRPDGTTAPDHVELSAADRTALEGSLPRREPVHVGPTSAHSVADMGRPPEGNIPSRETAEPSRGADASPTNSHSVDHSGGEFDHRDSAPQVAHPAESRSSGHGTSSSTEDPTSHADGVEESSGLPGHGAGSGGNGPEGTPVEPQPGWHGSSADRMRHHRRPALEVAHLTPEEQLAVLEREARQLADDALNTPTGSNVSAGQHRLEQGCAGSLLHDNTITAHSSTTKMHGQKLPHTHPVVEGVLKRISDDVAAGILEKKGFGHGKCAEISLISDRLSQLDPTSTAIRTVDDARKALEGSSVHTRRIGDLINRETGEVVMAHNAYLAACDTCKHVLLELGIHPHS
ncbi:YwqJ-related putative deaminase [Streptomyces sp. NBC_01471]|uniref:YwqJ-related putative deaminase n=1 Tax=Streptomyces sp. NBC_01471 TaxID=2903879 RepID=UPI003251B41C